MPKKKTATYAPTGDPEFEATWGKITDTLTSAGEVLDAAEIVRRRELTARALSTYSGKTYTTSSVRYRDATEMVEAYVDDTNALPEPDVLIIPPRPTDPYWYDDPKDAAVLDHYILRRRALGASDNGALVISGLPGYGKSMGAVQAVKRINAAHGLSLRLFKMDCATVSDPGKWFGRREADASGTHFIKSDFTEAVERGDVILLDDLARLHPHLHNPIFALLDGSEAVNLADLNVTIHRHPETVFIATINTGGQNGGQHRMDAAFRERLQTTIEREAPPRDEEIKILVRNTMCDEDAAAGMVDIARKTRDMRLAGDLRNEISTRTLVAAAEWVASGMNERDALGITATPQFDGDASGMVGAESDRQKVQALLEGKFGKSRR